MTVDSDFLSSSLNSMPEDEIQAALKFLETDELTQSLRRMLNVLLPDDGMERIHRQVEDQVVGLLRDVPAKNHEEAMPAAGVTIIELRNLNEDGEMLGMARTTIFQFKMVVNDNFDSRQGLFFEIGHHFSETEELQLNRPFPPVIITVILPCYGLNKDFSPHIMGDEDFTLQVPAVLVISRALDGRQLVGKFVLTPSGADNRMILVKEQYAGTLAENRGVLLTPETGLEAFFAGAFMSRAEKVATHALKGFSHADE